MKAGRLLAVLGSTFTVRFELPRRVRDYGHLAVSRLVGADIEAVRALLRRHAFFEELGLRAARDRRLHRRLKLGALIGRHPLQLLVGDWQIAADLRMRGDFP